ncbi:MAG TPA: phosphatidylserine decarboxylase family protein [Pirellulales bacterium]|nr:phosphatidylserine decarboxylase family protein [Pirellulales bacterium]
MSQLESSSARLDPLPMPANLTSVQPGGGFCYRVELAWGRWRRWYLQRFRPGYVRRMADLRRGGPDGAPHAVLDPRDLKYCRNQCECRWDDEHDPFRWRDKLRFARWGLAELLLMGVPLGGLTLAALWWNAWLAIVPAVLLAFVIYFFRDPRRSVPRESGVLVSPADGTVVEVTELSQTEFLDGPAVRIAIFLSIFNVHVNRSPADARVIQLRYHPGKFLDARDPNCSTLNESLWIGLQEDAPPHRRYVVRQVAGLIARRIVCNLRTGEHVDRGQKFGMIKFGSRTELIFPLEDGLEVAVKVGQKVHGASTVLARYAGPDRQPQAQREV